MKKFFCCVLTLILVGCPSKEPRPDPIQQEIFKAENEANFERAGYVFGGDPPAWRMKK